MAGKPMNEQMKELVNAIGVIAETSLLYYRTIVGAGATPEEAVRLTQAYIAALMFGGTGQKKSDDPPNNK